jgi:hypothetical protein
MHHQFQHSRTVISVHTLFICFVCISEQTATSAPIQHYWLVFTRIPDMKSVYCAVRNGSFKIVCSSSLNGWVTVYMDIAVTTISEAPVSFIQRDTYVVLSCVILYSHTYVCMHIYIHIYVCVYIYIYICVCVYIYVYIYIYSLLFVSMTMAQNAPNKFEIQ